MRSDGAHLSFSWECIRGLVYIFGMARFTASVSILAYEMKG